MRRLFTIGKRLPVILQSEVAECGLTCLAMISVFYGHKVNLLGLKKIFPGTARGQTLKQLIGLSNELGFLCRPVKLEVEELKYLVSPSILHWDMNHFVVLKKASSSNIVIHDPICGVRQLSYKAVGRHFSGIALEIEPAEEFDSIESKEKVSFRSLFGKVVGLKRNIFEALLLSLLLVFCSTITPFMMQLIFDDIVVSADLDFLENISLGLLFLLVFQAVVEFTRSTLLVRLGSLFMLQFGNSLFRKTMSLPISFFGKRQVGDIISRFRSIYEVKDFLAQGFVAAMIDGLMMVLTLVLVFFYSPNLSLIVLVALAIYSTARIHNSSKLQSLVEEQVIAQAKENSNFIESIKCIQSIHLYDGRLNRLNTWQSIYGEVVSTGARHEVLRSGYSILNQVIFGLERIFVLYLGASQVIDNQMTVGMFVAFLAYREQLVRRSSSIVDKFIELKVLDLHLDRISDIALAKSMKAAPTSSLNEKLPTTGSLEIRNLSFRYDPFSMHIFQGVDIDIPLGKTTAIVGPSGCGKTTLLKVILGLLEAESGYLKIGGEIVDDIRPFRDKVATVMQEDHLISGSIKDNIALFDENVDMSKVKQCAEMAEILEDITNMPMKFDTLVGDLGATLSGGQKQRILLARAFYREPKILFLDEATSHLDIRREKAIARCIRQLKMTKVLIAHRLETVKAADVVIYFNGRVCFKGSPKDYLENDGGLNVGGLV